MKTLENPNSQGPRSILENTQEEQIPTMSLEFPGMDVLSESPLPPPSANQPQPQINKVEPAESPQPQEETSGSVFRTPSSKSLREAYNEVVIGDGKLDELVPESDFADFSVKVSWDRGEKEKTKARGKQLSKSGVVSLVPSKSFVENPDFAEAEVRMNKGVLEYRMDDNLQFKPFQDAPDELKMAFNKEVDKTVDMLDVPADVGSAVVDVGLGLAIPGAGAIAGRAAIEAGKILTSSLAGYAIQDSTLGEKFASKFYDPAFVEYAKVKGKGKTDPLAMAAISSAFGAVSSATSMFLDKNTMKKLNSLAEEGKKVELDALRRGERFASEARQDFGVELTPGQAVSGYTGGENILNREVVERMNPDYVSIINARDEKQFQQLSSAISEVKQSVDAVGTDAVRNSVKMSSGANKSWVSQVEDILSREIGQVEKDQIAYAAKNNIRFSMDDIVHDASEMIYKNFPHAVVDGVIDTRVLAQIDRESVIDGEARKLIKTYFQIKNMQAKSRALTRGGSTYEPKATPDYVGELLSNPGVPLRISKKTPEQIQEIATLLGVSPDRVMKDPSIWAKIPHEITQKVGSDGITLSEISYLRRQLKSAAQFQKQALVGQSEVEKSLGSLYNSVTLSQTEMIANVAEKRGQNTVASKLRTDRELFNRVDSAVKKINKQIADNPSSTGKAILLADTNVAADVVELITDKGAMNEVRESVFDFLFDKFSVPNLKNGTTAVDGKKMIDFITDRTTPVPQNMELLFGKKGYEAVKKVATVAESIARTNPGRLTKSEQDKLIETVATASSFLGGWRIGNIVRTLMRGRTAAQQTYFDKAITDILFEAELSLGKDVNKKHIGAMKKVGAKMIPQATRVGESALDVRSSSQTQNGNILDALSR